MLLTHEKKLHSIGNSDLLLPSTNPANGHTKHFSSESYSERNFESNSFNNQNSGEKSQNYNKRQCGRGNSMKIDINVNFVKRLAIL